MPLSKASQSDLLLVLVTVLSALSWIFSREAVQLMPPLLFMCLRFMLAGTLLAILARRQLMEISGEQTWRAIRVGLVFGFAMCFWVLGLTHASHVGEGAFLTILGVLMVPLIGRFLFAETPPISTWLAIPVALVGLALLALKDGFRPEIGQIFFFTSAFGFAFYYALNTRAANTSSATNKSGEVRQRQGVPPLALTTLMVLTVSMVTGLASLVLEPWQPTFNNFAPMLYVWIAASAIIGTSARFFFQTWAQSLSTTSHGVVIMIVEPVWVALLAALWFGETMAPMQLAGCLLIFTALLVNRWGAVRKVLKSIL
ncbi:DMT family transporter [Alcanivorax sp. 1008]|uniref:DMT family transporter n=1 Tax=Alcanivorax sp. 1008 TaxID=2816853 RepID=UPI001D2E7933|nr:DMT family transporter [Alcanivorax sp. 1008]